MKTTIKAIMKATFIATFATVMGLQSGHGMEQQGVTGEGLPFLLSQSFNQFHSSIAKSCDQFYSSIKQFVENAHDDYFIRPKREKDIATSNFQINKNVPYIHQDLISIWLQYLIDDPSSIRTLYCSSKIFHEPILQIQSLILDIQRCPGDQLFYRRLANYCPNLEKVVFEGYDFDYNGLVDTLSQIRAKTPHKTLWYFMRNLNKLTVLELSSCQFHNEAVNFFEISLVRNISVKKLCLKEITGLDFRDIIRLLTLKQLVDLEVSESVITDIPFDSVMSGDDNIPKDLLMDKALTEISIDSKNRSPDFFKEYHLNRLSLVNCHLNDLQFGIIMHYCGRTVTCIDLSHNKITKDHNDFVPKILGDYTELETFNLTGNLITDEKVQKLREAVTDKSKLKILF